MRGSISVVVPILIKSNKHLAMTTECLNLAKKYTKLSFELIIVESGSNYFIEEADVHIYEKEITTPEISHNRGFKIARGEYITLLTNDTFVNDDWLECLIECFDIQDCGLSTLGNARAGHIRHDEIKEDYWFDVAMVARKIFDRIGYYDERFIGSWPDTDFLLRAYKADYKMYRNFNCIVDGTEPQATVGLNPNHNDNYIRGQQLFREKHENCGLAIYEAVK